jgi:putative nucleotidyltransferase with HDIG domain
VSDSPLELARRERVERLKERREKIGNVEKAFVKAATIMRNINRSMQTRPKECLEEVGELVDQMARAFLDAPDLTLHVMGGKAGGEEVYYHGLNTSILSMMLAKELGVQMEEARLLGLGALMHDIGLMDIPDRVLKKNPDEMTHAEIELRKLHCDYGVRLAVRAGLPELVQLIIYQHHEMIDGSGYPKGLKGESIHRLARIISMVNFYDNLCNPMDLSKALTPHEALSLMFAKHRSKFDAKVLQLMIRCLGVYPPGSIVKLSNDALALVQSVNPQKPLRPWVMVYDPAVPKEEAVMLDLEQELELSISKAIRPIQLPAAVYEYLSPRKRVTYFFDADTAQNGGHK